MKKLLWLLFSFDGCCKRWHFWLLVPATWIILPCIRLYLEIGLDTETMRYWLLMVATFGPFLFFLWITAAVQVKRWHDRNKSGNWIFINLIPIVGALWTFIELGFLPAKREGNRFARGRKSVRKISSSP